MSSKKCLVLSLVIVMALGLAACSGAKKNAATTAITAAEEAYNAAKADIAMYLPDDAKTVEDAIASAKASFEKKDFAGALAAVKDIPAKITELGTAAAAKKDELTKGWTELSGAMPATLETIKTKIEALAKVKKLPAGMTKEQLAGAKGSYDEMNTMWTDAQAAFTSGNLPDAMAKAQTIQAKAGELMTLLGITK